MLSNPYLDTLYPLQNQVLNILSPLPDFPFYLTGGTALNRFYFHNRYSDDLDFFSLQEIPDFRARIQQVVQTINRANLILTTETLSGHFCRMFIETPHTKLKLDMINDPVFHYGTTLIFPLFPKVDNTINILANKIAAIDRHEAKDIVDIWTLAKALPFSWREIISIAQKKAPVDPTDAAATIVSMPAGELEKIKWSQTTDPAEIFQDIQTIARDILTGNSNSLHPAQPA